MYRCRLPAVNCEGEFKKTQALLGGGRYEAWSKRWEIADFNLTAAPLPYKSPLSTTPSSTPLESSAPYPQNYIFPSRLSRTRSRRKEPKIEPAKSAFSTRTPPSPLPAHYPRAVTHPPSFPPRSSNISSPLQDRSSFPRNLIIPKREEVKKSHTAPPAQPNGREKGKQ